MHSASGKRALECFGTTRSALRVAQTAQLRENTFVYRPAFLQYNILLFFAIQSPEFYRPMVAYAIDFA